MLNRGTFMIEDLLQPRHLLVILAIFMLLFGGKKIPEMAKGLGEGIRNFKTAMKDDTEKGVDKT
jgi:sec-independent protein translocase protein TatA